jgi:hypothetical protein
MDARELAITLLCWGVLSSWMAISPTSFLKCFLFGRVQVSGRIAFAFRLVGVMSVVGVVASLVGQR